jgi:hypothetical protein
VAINSGLSSLPPAIVHRLNVDHLSVGLGDDRYRWRSSLDGTLITFGHGWPGGCWAYHRGRGCWTRIANAAVAAREGERFIRMGQVIP